MVTRDNPRFEDPDQIFDDIRRGFSAVDSVLFEPDRATAIDTVMQQAVVGDVILIAGKGREAYQEVQGRQLAYSDLAVIERIKGH
jgi:UDP-N-acetylmuramoyl-L-alanyl-D-glutamate--2,6-diaminopimelate ligase